MRFARARLYGASLECVARAPANVFVAPFFFFFFLKKVLSSRVFFFFLRAPFGQSHFASAGTLNFKEKVEKFPTS